jgi:hypothetical protein
MRTGRPAFHIKARWITLDLPAGSYYYKLDEKGNLIHTNGQVIAHRFVSAERETVDNERSPVARTSISELVTEEPQTPIIVTGRPPPRISTPMSRPTSVASADFPEVGWFDDQAYGLFGQYGDVNEDFFV